MGDEHETVRTSADYEVRGRTFRVDYYTWVSSAEILREVRRSFSTDHPTSELWARAKKIIIARFKREMNRRYFDFLQWFLSRYGDEVIKHERIEMGPKGRGFFQEYFGSGTGEFVVGGRVYRAVRTRALYCRLLVWDGQGNEVIVIPVTEHAYKNFFPHIPEVSR